MGSQVLGSRPNHKKQLSIHHKIRGAPGLAFETWETTALNPVLAHLPTTKLGAPGLDSETWETTALNPGLAHLPTTKLGALGLDSETWETTTLNPWVSEK